MVHPLGLVGRGASHGQVVDHAALGRSVRRRRGDRVASEACRRLQRKARVEDPVCHRVETIGVLALFDSAVAWQVWQFWKVSWLDACFIV